MMALVFLLGCWTQTESHCESEERDITDGEQLDLGFSVNEVFLRLETQTVDARDLFGITVPVQVSLTRGEGTAHLDDGTVIEEVLRKGGPNTHSTWVGEHTDCIDELAVPVVVTLLGSGVSVVSEARLINDTAFEPQLFHVVGPLDPEADIVPAGLHGAPVGGEAWVTYDADGRLVHVDVVAVTADSIRETVLWFDEPVF